MTGRAHCQRQVAFLNTVVTKIIVGQYEGYLEGYLWLILTLFWTNGALKSAFPMLRFYLSKGGEMLVIHEFNVTRSRVLVVQSGFGTIF